MSKIGSVPLGVFDNRFGQNSNLPPVPAPIVAFGFAHATQVMMNDVTPLLQGPERLEATPACVRVCVGGRHGSDGSSVGGVA